MLRQSASERKEARAISITWQKNSSAFIWLILTSDKEENAESGLILNKTTASGNGLPRQRRGSVERIMRSRLAFARDFDKRDIPFPTCRGYAGPGGKTPAAVVHICSRYLLQVICCQLSFVMPSSEVYPVRGWLFSNGCEKMKKSG